MAKITAVYVRVSTSKQDTRSQVADLKRWLAAHQIEAEWFQDKASGRSMDRPAWNRLNQLIIEGQVERIIIWRLDRLGRTASGLTKLFDELCRRKVNLVSIKDSLDLSTPAGRLMANVLASVAAYENEVRTERIIAGQSAARADGKRWGGSQKGRRIKVTIEQAATIRRLHGENEPIAAIARATGLSRPTIYNVLGSPAH